MDRTIEALQATPSFAGVSADTLGFLLGRGRHVARAEGEHFFREGELGEHFYLVERGAVAIYKQRDDVRRDLGELGEGDCFGEMALLSVAPRSASVIAVSYCMTLELSNAALFDLYCESPEQFLMIVMNLGREVCRRLRELNDRLLNQAVAASAAAEAVVDKDTTV